MSTTGENSHPLVVRSKHIGAIERLTPGGKNQATAQLSCSPGSIIHSAKSHGKVDLRFRGFGMPRNGCSGQKSENGKNKLVRNLYAPDPLHHSKLKLRVTTRQISMK